LNNGRYRRSRRIRAICGAAPVANAPAAAPTSAGTAAVQASPVATPVADTGCWPDDAKGVVQIELEDGTKTMKQYQTTPAMVIDQNKTYRALLQTNKGDVEVEFFPKEAPNTVNNFVCLARDGYYDGTPFHRIVKGFMIQGGDPTGTGTGGPGYKFADEKVVRPYNKGIMAMANAGPNTNGSQFFIMLENYPLPPNYTIFGQVVSGQDIVDLIGGTKTRPGRSGENSTPTEPITLEKVTITES